ncbi:hypothetical protein [Metapseudomonas furukawaii]|jgi:hypothetical protein|uniref:Uncharacterized protein n=1 Tax=Metapseudomonas furukawaii TaxID=1149133 RepID=A0AAD1C407_METFU|nr:hypothetical protein [Pseudomonas furukawaii]ELS29329.1 hypothetical protein ppKF707_0154 [Pseudomonas furukawaii]BAU76517.1 hypothetical protein KF707C_48290 [Pseudomonas furukawaii]
MTDAQFIACILVLIALLSLRLAKALGLFPRPHTGRPPVQGRRTGLSEHASPFGQTERRAKRTLDRPPP